MNQCLSILNICFNTYETLQSTKQQRGLAATREALGFRSARTAARRYRSGTVHQISGEGIQRRESEVRINTDRQTEGTIAKLVLMYIFNRFSRLLHRSRFWESVQEMKALPQSQIKEKVNSIWREFLSPDAACPVNVDSKSIELAREAVQTAGTPNRWCFDVAAAHVYHLMKSDSYSRYLRSDMYKDFLNGSRKKVKSIPNLFGVKR